MKRQASQAVSDVRGRGASKSDYYQAFAEDAEEDPGSLATKQVILVTTPSGLVQSLAYLYQASLHSPLGFLLISLCNVAEAYRERTTHP